MKVSFRYSPTLGHVRNVETGNFLRVGIPFGNANPDDFDHGTVTGTVTGTDDVKHPKSTYTSVTTVSLGKLVLQLQRKQHAYTCNNPTQSTNIYCSTSTWRHYHVILLLKLLNNFIFLYSLGNAIETNHTSSDSFRNALYSGIVDDPREQEYDPDT